MVAPKLCKDCKWAKVSWLDRILFFEGYRFAKCSNPKSGLIERSNNSLVTGEPPKFDLLWCSTQRQSQVEGRCGEAGTYWEAK